MMTASGERLYRRALSLTVLTSLLLLLPAYSLADVVPRFHAFTNLGCESCVEALEPLLNMYGETVTTYDIRQTNNTELFDRIVSFVGSNVYTEIPLVIVLKGDRLAAIVFWTHLGKDWEEILKAEYEGVPVYSNLYDLSGRILPDKILKEQNVTDSITRLFVKDGQVDNNGGRDVYTLFPLVALAALADAVNPCEFYILAVFLSLIFFRIGRRSVLKAGLAYSLAVFATYYLLGFGLLRLISYAQQLRFLVVAVFGFLGLAVGLREIIGSLLRREFKRVPDAFSGTLLARLGKVSENPISAFVIGIASGIFLLPCTSAPYFVALSLISRLESLLEGLLLLTVYNSIVVIPFIVITLCIHTLHLRTADLKRWPAQKQRWLNLGSGLLITFLALYLLSSLVT